MAGSTNHLPQSSRKACVNCIIHYLTPTISIEHFLCDKTVPGFVYSAVSKIKSKALYSLYLYGKIENKLICQMVISVIKKSKAF